LYRMGGQQATHLILSIHFTNRQVRLPLLSLQLALQVNTR
jgi:hypothetical protein